MSLTKADMISKLFDQFGINKREAKELIDCFFETIKVSLENGEDVKVTGFGKFHILKKGRRPGRNPKTGEEVIIEPRSVVSFYCSQRLRAQITEEISKRGK